MSWWRLIFYIILCLILALALIFYFSYLSPGALKAHVKAILQQHLAAEITLGAVQLRPLTGLTLQGVSIGRKPGAEKLFWADKILIRPDWFSLLKLKFRIKELSLQNADLIIRKEPSGRLNWDNILKEKAAPMEGKPPVLSLINGKVTIGPHVFQGVNCELTSFPTDYLIAIRGTWNDPFWGNYILRGNINTKYEKLKLFLENETIDVTESWVVNFPFVGKKVWEKYHPAGLFGFTGNITFCWGEKYKTDYNLIYTAKDSSCKWLIFPVTNATGRIIIDPTAVIINHLDGKLFRGDVEGYSIVNLRAPFSFYSRYSFNKVDMAEFLKDFQTEDKSIEGLGSGYVSFQGDHSLDIFQGRGELNIPDAQLWKFPIILNILSNLQLAIKREEPRQDCRIVFSFTQKGLKLEEISLVSDVFDIYGVGSSGWDGKIDLRFYVRPMSKTPLLLADALLQPALDSLSGNIAQFKITGTVREPRLSVIPFTPLSKQIMNFFNALTNQRILR